MAHQPASFWERSLRGSQSLEGLWPGFYVQAPLNHPPTFLTVGLPTLTRPHSSGLNPILAAPMPTSLPPTAPPANSLSTPQRSVPTSAMAQRPHLIPGMSLVFQMPPLLPWLLFLSPTSTAPHHPSPTFVQRISRKRVLSVEPSRATQGCPIPLLTLLCSSNYLTTAG